MPFFLSPPKMTDIFQRIFNLPNGALPPGFTHQSHLIRPNNPHPAGPFGDNGTQQFVRRTDAELWALIFPVIKQRILSKYEGEEAKKALNMIAQLDEIKQSAVAILRHMQMRTGYPPNEIVRGLKCQIKALGKKHSPVYRVLLIAFAIAEIWMELNPPRPTNPAQRPPPPSYESAVRQSQKRANEIVDKLDALDKETKELIAQLHKLFPQ
jgi:hypothetical protein